MISLVSCIPSAAKNHEVVNAVFRKVCGVGACRRYHHVAGWSYRHRSATCRLQKHGITKAGYGHPEATLSIPRGYGWATNIADLAVI